MFDQEFWFVFGTSTDCEYVDISDRNRDVLRRVPIEYAELICEAHNLSLERLESEYKKIVASAIEQ